MFVHLARVAAVTRPGLAIRGTGWSNPITDKCPLSACGQTTVQRTTVSADVTNDFHGNQSLEGTPTVRPSLSQQTLADR